MLIITIRPSVSNLSNTLYTAMFAFIVTLIYSIVRFIFPPPPSPLPPPSKEYILGNLINYRHSPFLGTNKKFFLIKSIGVECFPIGAGKATVTKKIAKFVETRFTAERLQTQQGIQCVKFFTGSERAQNAFLLVVDDLLVVSKLPSLAMNIETRKDEIHSLFNLLYYFDNLLKLKEGRPEFSSKKETIRQFLVDEILKQSYVNGAYQNLRQSVIAWILSNFQHQVSTDPNLLTVIYLLQSRDIICSPVQFIFANLMMWISNANGGSIDLEDLKKVLHVIKQLNSPNSHERDHQCHCHCMCEIAMLCLFELYTKMTSILICDQTIFGQIDKHAKILLEGLFTDYRSTDELMILFHQNMINQNVKYEVNFYNTLDTFRKFFSFQINPTIASKMLAEIYNVTVPNYKHVIGKPSISSACVCGGKTSINQQQQEQLTSTTTTTTTTTIPTKPFFYTLDSITKMLGMLYFDKSIFIGADVTYIHFKNYFFILSSTPAPFWKHLNSQLTGSK